jgi:hypothetical protein
MDISGAPSHRARLLAALLCLPLSAFAQSSIPAGTILPVQLDSSLSSRKSKPGQKITVRIMQDVPLSSTSKLPAGAKVMGRVVSVTAGPPSEISFRFDAVRCRHKVIPIRTNLRAIASMMEVQDAQVPDAGPDRGTPWAWVNRDLIGGEVAYGQGGPVTRGDDVVGQSLFGGVLAKPRENRTAGCRGEVGENEQLQALWVFSSDACGAFGLGNVQIAHHDRTAPGGEITLSSATGTLSIRGGSGLLLRVE